MSTDGGRSSQEDREVKVTFYDTLLRDGEQMPGIAFGREARLRIAHALDDLGLSEIEIGFAASGREQRDDMRAVVDAGLRAKLLSLARPMAGDIEAAREAGVDGVILFIGSSDIHLREKLRRTEEEVAEIVRREVARAKDAGFFVQMSFEDATRTDHERLGRFVALTEEAGADRIGLADTVGIGTPESMKAMVRSVREATSLPVAVHCHDDFGLAVANSLAAVEAGARVLSTTINGIGERSGNAATEVCATALNVLYGIETDVQLAKVTEVSRLVSELSGLAVTPACPVVGLNSFRHESGIHVAAILRDPATYEAYDPALVGARREIVLGKTTGRTAIRHLAGPAADRLTDADLEWIISEVKSLAESGLCGDANVLKGLVEQCRQRLKA